MPESTPVTETADMPGKTHRIGYVDTGRVLALIQARRGSPDNEESGDTALADLGVDDLGVLDLWSGAHEEFGQPTPESVVGPGLLNPARPLTLPPRWPRN